MLKSKNIGISFKQNSKIICLYNALHARTFHAHLKSLRVRYTHAYEHTLTLTNTFSQTWAVTK